MPATSDGSSSRITIKSSYHDLAQFNQCRIQDLRNRLKLRSTINGREILADPMDKRSTSIVVRPFGSEDAGAVVTMMKELAAFHHDEASATASDVVRFAYGVDRISSILVASLGAELCGFSATYDWMNYVHGFPVRNIDLFFVRESARGRGVGRALLKQIACEAKSSACQRITVGAEPDNEDANAFYQEMGFELRRPASNRYALSGAAFDQLAGA